MILSRVTDDADPLVGLAEIKAHLRVRHDDEDGLIDALYRAAISYIDGPRGVLARCITPQAWQMAFQPGEWRGGLRLPVVGVTEVTAAEIDPVGGQQSLPVVRHDCGVWTDVHLSPTGDRPVIVTFQAESPKDIWPTLVLAVKLLVGHWYLNREAVVTGTTVAKVPFSVEALLSPLKLQWV